MKLIILSIIVALNSIGCTNTKEHYTKTAINIVIDKTDTLLTKPVATSILRTSNMYNKLDNAYTCNVTTITALEHTPVYSVSVGNKQETDAYNSSYIPDFRNIVLQQFIKQVTDTIAYCMKDSTVKDYTTSSCFETISKALSNKEFQQADNKVLFVYSDLLQYNELFDIYHSNASVTELVKLFEDTKQLPPKLTNTKIYCVYQPKNAEDDKRFTTMFQVYKTLLEKLGGEVIQITKL